MKGTELPHINNSMRSNRVDRPRMFADCLACLARNITKKIPSDAPEEVRRQYVQRVYALLADAPISASAPLLSREMLHIREDMFGKQVDYPAIKSYYNKKMMAYLPKLREEIKKADDPLKRAVQYAACGNYIDFSVPQGVSEEKLEELISVSENIDVSEEKMKRLCSSLEQTENLVYLLDNCGEIVLDRLLMEEIRKEYQNIRITAVVRGGEIMNDVTQADADQIELQKVATVMHNGDDIAGNALDRISDEAKKALFSADTILAKGQGNFETLGGCGLNVFYLFLCKCDFFSQMFRVPLNTGMVLHDDEV